MGFQTGIRHHRPYPQYYFNRKLIPKSIISKIKAQKAQQSRAGTHWMLRLCPFAVPRLGYLARIEDRAFNLFLHSRKSWLRWKSVEAERGSPSLTLTTQAKKIMDILHGSIHEDNLEMKDWSRFVPKFQAGMCQDEFYSPLELNSTSGDTSAIARQPNCSQTLWLCSILASQMKRWGRGFDRGIFYLKNIPVFPPALPKASEMLREFLTGVCGSCCCLWCAASALELQKAAWVWHFSIF